MPKLRPNDFKADLENDLLKSDLKHCDWGLTAESEITGLGMEDNSPLKERALWPFEMNPMQVLLVQCLGATDLPGGPVICLWIQIQPPKANPTLLNSLYLDFKCNI